jgi:RimJ/RimL family protein N-acetyltransferase
VEPIELPAGELLLRRVAVKAGFSLEGRLRRSHRYGDGVRHDELLWSRLSDDR